MPRLRSFTLTLALVPACGLDTFGLSAGELVTSATGSSGSSESTDAPTSTGVPDPDTDPTTTTTTTTTSATDDTSTTTAVSATDDSDATTETPTCDAAPEPDAACAAQNGATPVCHEGVCVECTPDADALCTGVTPICGAGNTCVACTQHDDCPDSSCDLESGACMAVERVLYVDGTATCPAGTGAKATPFCDLDGALDLIALSDKTLGWTVRIASGNYLAAPVTVSSGTLITLAGRGPTLPRLRADTGATLTIQSGAKVFLERLALENNVAGGGVVCNSARVWVDETRLSNNSGRGYTSNACVTKIRRSVVFFNKAGGLSSQGLGSTWLWNSYVTGNGDPNGGVTPGIRSSAGNELHVIYSTIVNNLSTMGAGSLQCMNAGSAEVRNSVVISFAGDSIDCPDVQISRSAVDDGAADGEGNYAAIAGDIMTFFTPQQEGVYLAKPGTALVDLARWKAGDPATDFLGVPRPTTDDAPDHAGAVRP